MKNDGFTFRKRLRSFRYAFNGIRLLVTKEHNAWIHCFAAVCVVAAGFLLDISQTEWIAVVVVIGAVLALEAVNSALEAIANFVSPEYSEAIKRTKDLAAGAILLMAIAAAVVGGGIIFFPKLAALF
ncbi:MAG: diacylglycerol kinase family protein [Parabacteroides sp.]|nr:diacylglycerol kinase family protein [Parabacteroides sp.]